MKGIITQLKRFAVHDGPGIRTTVFFKGCPLKCIWCHNPEGIGYQPQLAYYQSKCMDCGMCATLCPSKAHKMEATGHEFLRQHCLACGQCAQQCPADALQLYGREVTAESLLPQLLEDREFYENTGGGVTLSGGECLSQADFCIRLLQELKQQGIHTAVDTCGFVSQKVLGQAAAYTDLFLYDIKALDADVHKRCTGQSNEQILDNLAYLDALGKQIHIRIPFVPEYNEDQMEKIAAFLSPFRHITQVKVLPYHKYAGSKYEALGMENTLPDRLPTEAVCQAAQSVFFRP